MASTAKTSKNALKYKIPFKGNAISIFSRGNLSFSILHFFNEISVNFNLYEWERKMYLDRYIETTFIES